MSAAASSSTAWNRIHQTLGHVVPPTAAATAASPSPVDVKLMSAPVAAKQSAKGKMEVTSLDDLRTDVGGEHKQQRITELLRRELTDADTQQFVSDVQTCARDGYVILSKLISTEMCERIRTHFLTSTDMTTGGASKKGRNTFEGINTQRVYGVVAKQPREFDILAEHPRVVRLLEVFVPKALLSAYQVIRILPEEKAQLIHFDDAFIPTARPRAAYGAATVWAIDEFTGENGATVVYPKSHRWGKVSIKQMAHGDPKNDGLQPITVTGEIDPEKYPYAELVKETFEPGFAKREFRTLLNGDVTPKPTDARNFPSGTQTFHPVSAVMPEGSCVFFLSTLFHGGGSNRSKAARFAISTQYCAPYLRPQENLMVGAGFDVARECSPLMRHMLGYSIHPPFVGHVGGLSPLRLLKEQPATAAASAAAGFKKPVSW